MTALTRILLLCLPLQGVLAADPQAGSRAVSCLGRLVPGHSLTLVEVPYFTQEPPILTELLVKEGDRVTQGQVLARTHHHPIAKAMFEESEAALLVAQRTLELTKAGAEPTVVAAQKALYDSQKASSQLEEHLYQRRVNLEKENAISAEELDIARVKAEMGRKNLEQAEKNLLALTVVQKEKITLGEAQVSAALASLEKAKATLALTEIRAPFAGMILRIHAWPGEKAEREGLLEMGDVAHMRVEAEVYVSDIRHVKAGQKAELRGEAFEGKLSATVEAVTPLVRPNQFVNTDPKSIRENRVVTVWLTVDEPSKVETLSGAEVSVVIGP